MAVSLLVMLGFGLLTVAASSATVGRRVMLGDSDRYLLMRWG